MKKQWFTNLIVAVVLISLLGFFVYDNMDVIQNFINTKIKKYTSEMNFSDAKNSSDDESIKFPYTTSTGGWEYTFYSIEITQKIPEFITHNKDYYFTNYPELHNGVLPENSAYIVINTTIKNTLAESREYLVNCISFVPLDENMLQWAGGELKCFEHAYMTGSHRCHYEFEKFEVLTTVLVYTLSLEEIDIYSGYIFIDNIGSFEFNEDKRLIKVYSENEGLNENFYKD